MSVRRALAATLAFLALLLPAGCAALPTSGEPHEFAIEAPQREPLRQYGSAPQPGSSPERLVEDFLLASSAGTYDDYATARLYLTPEASVTWHPGEQVVIFPSDSPPEPETKTELTSVSEVVLTLHTIGSVDTAGLLNTTESGGTTSVSFVLERNNDGEWRIATLEAGLILSQSAFLNSYQEVNLYFPSADLMALIPDPRWYPRARVASHLVQGLIDGPAEMIAPAVTGDLAASLSLPTAGVDVKDRVATVVLEGSARSSEEEKLNLYWSLHATLRQLPAVQTVTVRLNGVELPEDMLPHGPDYRLDRLVGIRDGSIVSGTTTTTLLVADASQAGEGAAEPAVGPLTTSPYAWVNPQLGALNIVDMLADGGRSNQALEVVEPGAPSIDRWGSVWLTSGAVADAVIVVSPSGQTQTVALDREGQPQVVALSPDGARAAVLLQVGDQTEVILAAVVRDDTSGAYKLEQPYVAAQMSPEVTDLTWVGEATLAALVRGASGEPMVESYPLGGWLQTMSAPSSVVRITAASILGSLIVQAADGTAYQRVGAAWIALPGELEQVSYAG